MTVNTAGLAGAQVFQAHDAPLHRTGFTVILSLASIGLIFAAVSNAQYLWLNKRLQRKETSEQEAREGGNLGQGWRYSL